MLKNKVCIVTGASRGIGYEIAKMFAENGAVVYANVRNEETFCEKTALLESEVRERIVPSVFDVNDAGAFKKEIVRIKKTHGKIDVLVNNAAVSYNECIGMISPKHVEEMFRTNVFSVLESIQLVGRVMQRQKFGSIINISSIVGQRGDKGQIAYSATKGAVIAITKSAAKELAEYGIRVNSVAPGLTDTDMLHETDISLLGSRINNIGMKRLAVPEDIANACLFFASDMSEYISGEILGVNGCSVL